MKAEVAWIRSMATDAHIEGILKQRDDALAECARLRGTPTSLAARNWEELRQNLAGLGYEKITPQLIAGLLPGRWAPEPIPATVLDPWPSDWDDRESG